MEPGHRLAQYEIKARIGAGGMGEVFAARDTNLDRDVAVKVLPRDLADDAMRLARLEREAKAIAALSHPNILAVHDFGTDEGTAYVVTELLAGETLRERLAGGGLAPRKAAEYGRQIARGLAAAHDKGIVHRDLKPDNIFLTGDGRVKILDFGLATVAGTGGAPADDATMEMGTRTGLTKPGAVLGTVDYMAPEQVRGEPTDARSDLFAFGSVLYEMITGARPFHRETAAETMTAILKEEPPEFGSQAADVPPALAAIVRRCLEKRPGERFHSAHDLAFSLEALSGSSLATGSVPSLPAAGARRRGPLVAAALVVAGLVVGVAATWLLRPSATPEAPVRYTSLSSRRGVVTAARFTGSESAIYSAAWGGGPLQLYPATAGSRTSDPLNIGPAELLSVSSTGELAVALDRRFPLGWEAHGTLAIAQPGGAAPRPILENVLVADWAPDGRSLAVAHEVDGAVRLEYPIGTVIYESPGWISGIRVNPDGDRVLIADCPGRGDNVAFTRIVHRDGTVEDLGFGGSWGALWAPDGETVLSSNGGVIVRMRPGHEPERLMGTPSPLRLLDVSPTGRMLIASSENRREMIVHAPGEQNERDFSWQDWTTPRLLSNDGRWAVFEEGNDANREGYAVYLRNTDGSAPLHLGYGGALALSPDGSRIALVKRPYADDSSLVLVPTGPGEPRPVDLGGLNVVWVRGFWLAAGEGHGESLVVLGRRGDEPVRIYRLWLDGTAPQAITPPDFALAPSGHRVSADGRRLIVKPASGAAVAFGIEGDGPHALAGVLPTDNPVDTDASGRHLYVQAGLTLPSPVYRVDTETGERTLWREIAPRDPAGVFVVDRLRITPDGSAYIYSLRRQISRLMYLEGLR